MKPLCIAAAFGFSLVSFSPCLALTVTMAPASSQGGSQFSDPDARLEATTSAMQDAYIQNNSAPPGSNALNGGNSPGGQAITPLGDMTGDAGMTIRPAVPNPDAHTRP